MSLKTQRSLRNALLNRVRRHATIATIFNTSDPVHPLDPMVMGTGSLPEYQTLDRENLVQATLLSHPTQPTYTSQSELNPYISREPSIADTSEQKKSKPPTHLDPLINQPQNSYEDSINQEKTLPSSDQDEDDDSTWRKLKAIFRKHQEKDTQQITPIRPKPSEHNHLQMEIDIPGNKGNNENNLSAHQSTGMELSQEHFESQPDTPVRKVTSSRSGLRNDPLKTSNPIIHRNEKPIIEPVDQPHREYQEDLQKSNSMDSGDIKKEVGSGTSDHRPSMLDEKDKIKSNTDVSPDLSLHDVPLEAAWPVQKQEIHGTQKEKTGENLEYREDMTDSVNQVPNPDFQTQAGTETIQRALKNVAPSQATSSSVELIIPRRPRPISPVRAKIEGDSNSTKMDEPRAQPVPQNSTHHKTDLHPEAIDRLGTENLSGKDSFPGHRSEDAQPEMTSRGIHSTKLSDRSLVEGALDSQVNSPQELKKITKINNDTEPDLVHTDIGPLPVDLWQILNHDIPRTARSSDSQTEPLPIKTNQPIELIRNPASQETRIDSPVSKQPKKLITSYSEDVNIQRSVSSDGNDNVITSASITEGDSETNPEGETSQNEEPDINELSRQVYSEIKRQMMVEWERSRNRN